MATRNKRKLAALNKENCEEHPRSNLAQSSAAPRSQEDYITQVSEEIEGRVTKELSQEFSRTENRILRALAQLDDFLMHPLLQGHSGTTPVTSRNAFSVNQGTNEDDFQSDPHPEVGHFHGQTSQNSGPEVGHRISKLPKSLTTTMPTFDGKSEKFELFEDLFQTSLKIHNQLTEGDRINYFHSLMRGDALQTFKNINGPTRENLGEILAVFRRK